VIKLVIWKEKDLVLYQMCGMVMKVTQLLHKIPFMHFFVNQFDALLNFLMDSNVNLNWEQRKSKESKHAPLLVALNLKG